MLAAQLKKPEGTAAEWQELAELVQTKTPTAKQVERSRELLNRLDLTPEYLDLFAVVLSEADRLNGVIRDIGGTDALHAESLRLDEAERALKRDLLLLGQKQDQIQAGRCALHTQHCQLSDAEGGLQSLYQRWGPLFGLPATEPGIGEQLPAAVANTAKKLGITFTYFQQKRKEEL